MSLAGKDNHFFGSEAKAVEEAVDNQTGHYDEASGDAEAVAAFDSDFENTNLVEVYSSSGGHCSNSEHCHALEFEPGSHHCH
jgi:hypothetical protein